MDDVESAKWKIEKEEEMDSLEKKKTWYLIEITKERRVVGCNWVYKLKKGVDGRIERYKLRLVTKEYSQMEVLQKKQAIYIYIILINLLFDGYQGYNHVYTQTEMNIVKYLANGCEFTLML